MLHQLKRKVDKSIDQGRRVIPVESFPEGREGVKLLPSSFPTLKECLTAHLLWSEIGSKILRAFQ
jgi:hypothetical protein